MKLASQLPPFTVAGGLRAHRTNVVGRPLVVLRQDPDLVPSCPVCSVVVQHTGHDPDGEWSCDCSDDQHSLPDWLFWVASHTVCQHCGVGPSGDLDGLYCSTTNCSAPGDHYAPIDVPVSPAVWLQQNHRNFAQETKAQADDSEETPLHRAPSACPSWHDDQCRCTVANLEHTIARAEKAEANYQFMVDRVADEKLDGYRELGARAAAAENELMSKDHAMHNAVAKAIQYCRDGASTAQRSKQPAVALALREVAVHFEALLPGVAGDQKEKPHYGCFIGDPLMEASQDPSLVPGCPVCGELHQHSSDDPNGRWSCGCNAETHLLEDWLFWVAANTVCSHCEKAPAGDHHGLWCGVPEDQCCTQEVPLSPVEWIMRHSTVDRDARQSVPVHARESMHQQFVELSSRLDKLEAANATVDKTWFGEIPLEGCLLPQRKLVLFRGLHGEWHVRCLLGNEELLECQLGRLDYPTKQDALLAIADMVTVEDYPENQHV